MLVIIFGIVLVQLNCLEAICTTPSIAIFGASGKLGSECVYQALNNGSKVSVLARNISRITIPPGSGGDLAGQKIIHPNLKIFEGSVSDQKSVDKVFENNDIEGVVIG
jgi:uncharacterized protein YbjT (DUF2867 family)